jgi:hypothetical protein
MKPPKSQEKNTPSPNSSLGDRMTDVSDVRVKISGVWVSLDTGKKYVDVESSTDSEVR